MYIHHCHFHYPNFALDIQQLQLNKGQLYALIGGNGAGKTTFFNCLAGRIQAQLQVSEGFDKTLLHNAFATLNEQLTVAQHLAFVQSLHDATPSQRDAVIADFGLQSLLHQRPGQLSAGQYTRLRLAKSLLASPDLILLDEPTTGLQVSAAMDVVRSIEALLNKGVTVMVSTHHLIEMARLKPHLIGLKDGKNVLDTPWRDEFDHYQGVIDIMMSLDHVPSTQRQEGGSREVA